MNSWRFPLHLLWSFPLKVITHYLQSSATSQRGAGLQLKCERAVTQLPLMANELQLEPWRLLYTPGACKNWNLGQSAVTPALWNSTGKLGKKRNKNHQMHTYMKIWQPIKLENIAEYMQGQIYEWESATDITYYIVLYSLFIYWVISN